MLQGAVISRALVVGLLKFERVVLWTLEKAEPIPPPGGDTSSLQYPEGKQNVLQSMRSCFCIHHNPDV